MRRGTAIEDVTIQQVFPGARRGKRLAYPPPRPRELEIGLSLALQVAPPSQVPCAPRQNSSKRHKGILAETLVAPSETVLTGRYAEQATKLRELFDLSRRLPRGGLSARLGTRCGSSGGD